LRCHVEVDTGMGRTGVRLEEALDFIERLSAFPALRLASVFTHFPDADGADLAFSRAQLEGFEGLLRQLAERGIRPPRVHDANSSGRVNLPASRYAWLRAGLLAYGHRPPRCDAAVELKPVMAFKSRLAQIRDLPAGTPISYGRTFVTQRPTRSGVVAVGY